MAGETDDMDGRAVTVIGEMMWSEECADIFGAFARAQSNLRPLVAAKTAKVPYKKKDGTKGEYSYKYAGLPDTLAACLAAYTAEGCAIVQPVSTFEDGVGIRTLITHESGQWWLSPKVFMPVERGAGAQDLGSAITYGRRYSLQGATATTPADDDGKAAQGAKPKAWSRPSSDDRPTTKRRVVEDQDPFMTGRLATKAAATMAKCAKIAASKSTDDKVVSPRDVWEGACAKFKLPPMPDGSTPKIENLRKSIAWPICELVKTWTGMLEVDAEERQPGDDGDEAEPIDAEYVEDPTAENAP